MLQRDELVVGAMFAGLDGDVWEVLSINDNDQTLRAIIVEPRPKTWTINRAQHEWEAADEPATMEELTIARLQAPPPYHLDGDPPQMCDGSHVE